MRVFLVLMLLYVSMPFAFAQANSYKVGVGDILSVNILQPDPTVIQVTVTPKGNISVPYLGSLPVTGKTIDQIQKNIENGLKNRYLKYPVVMVTLIESKSKNYTILGEVANPGSYPIKNNMTVLKAISDAGWFTKYGSNKIKVLRPKTNKPGYTIINVDVKKIIDGKQEEDLLIKNGDIIVVSESLF